MNKISGNFNVFMSSNLQRSMVHRSYPDFLRALTCIVVEYVSDYCSSETREQEYRNRKKVFGIRITEATYTYIFLIQTSQTSNDYTGAIGYNVKYSNGRMLTVFIHIKLNSLTYCFLGLFIDLNNLAIYSSFFSDNAVLGLSITLRFNAQNK